MPIKFTYETEADVPADMLGYYEEADGVWTLDVEGAHSDKAFGDIRGLLDKERKNHRQTKQRLDKFGETTPEEITSLRDENTTLQAQIDGHEDGGDVDKLSTEKAERMTEKMRKSYEAKETSWLEQDTAKNNTILSLETARDRGKIQGDLAKAAGLLNWKEGYGATRDLMVKDGLSMFRFVDGDIVKYREDDPDAIEYSAKDGTKPLSPAEWVAEWAITNPHNFAPKARGLGANGSDNRTTDARDLSHLKPADRIAKDRERNAR